MTPESFEVRLAQIDYVDDDGSLITSRLGFLIEDIDDTARRNGQRRFRDVNSIEDSQLDPTAAARVALFQYMIGNLDWAITGGPVDEDCCHNSRLIGMRGETTGLAPVPYDFDFSGLVGTPYAEPPATIRGGRRIFMVRNVRIRLYRGFCEHNEEAQAVAADMLARRASLLATFDETPFLGEATRQQAAAYLGEFFDDIGSPQEVARLLEDCRGS